MSISPRGNVYIKAPKQKMDYLIRERQDQRSRDPRAPSYVLPEKDLTGMALPRERFVVSAATLAAAIGISATSLAHVCTGERGLPYTALKKICRIFAIEESSLQFDEPDVFIARCKGKIANAAASDDWRKMVVAASTTECQMLLQDPFGLDQSEIPIHLRYAKPDETKRKGHLPRVAHDVPFWIGVTSPLDTNSNPLWGGWHIVLFNHDVGNRGFSCMLPRFADAFGFAETLYPASRTRFFFPRLPNMKHEACDGDRGEFEMVVVLAKDVVPDGILQPLCAADAQGLALEPTLGALAHWLESRVRNQTALVTKVAYEVVEEST